LANANLATLPLSVDKQLQKLQMQSRHENRLSAMSTIYMPSKKKSISTHQQILKSQTTKPPEYSGQG